MSRTRARLEIAEQAAEGIAIDNDMLTNLNRGYRWFSS